MASPKTSAPVAFSDLLSVLKGHFGEVVLAHRSDFGDDTIVVQRERWLDVFRFLKSAPSLAFNYLVDLTCVDYFGQEPRFEMVVHLLAFESGKRLRVKARIPEEDATIASLVPLWRSANWLEREVYDMFGVRFAGHPDLRRILMYDEFEGYPLRKDYPLKKSQPRVPLLSPEREEEEEI
jgi:NADH-quinone oxidoreductase subunit C